MKKLLLFLILLFCASITQSFAQFEGKIQFDSYDVKSGNKKADDDSFTMYVTADRILLQGDKSYKVGGALKTEGVLIRQKEKDFMLLTSDKQAMQITKSGITSFINMFGSDANQNIEDAESNINYKKTGKTDKIRGYNCEKFIFTDKQNPDKRAEVWMTQDVNINWGILAEPWGENLKGLTGDNLPLKLIFQEGYFPIRWSQYENGELTSKAEAKITPTNVARQMVQIPSDVQVVSLQDYLFQQMRKNQ